MTTQFYLAADPYFPATSKSTIISEHFNEAQINQRVWGVTGGAGYLSLGAGGLAMNGGNGIDGETLLAWLDPVEMGGTLLLEAVGVTLRRGSTGTLAGFFIGTGHADCMYRGLSSDGTAGHGGCYAAAVDSRERGGNDLCGQSGVPIHAACQSALPGE